jgi:hypothetical protein
MQYGEFLASVEPVIMGLDSATCSIDRTAFWSQSKDARKVLSSKYELAHIATDYFDIQATYGIAIEWSEDDGPVIQPLKIGCVFSGHFHAAAPVAREHAQQFTDDESWLIFWPFFRQFVADTAARMAIPPLLVPLALRPGEHSYRRPPKTITQRKHRPRRIASRKK